MNYTNLANALNGSTYTGMTAAQILTAINTQTGSPTAVPTSAVLIWAASTGVRATLQATAATAGPLQSAALAALDMFTSGAPTFDLSNAEIQTMIAAFVSGGVITQAQANSLNALGLPPSVATTTLGRAATATDVTQAQLMQQVLALRVSAIKAQNAVLAQINTVAIAINNGTTPAIPTTTQLGSTYSGAI